MEDQQPLPQAQQTAPQAAPKEIPTEGHSATFRKHKSLIIAAVIALVLGIVGVSTFIGFDSSSQYHGYIKKIEAQTQKLESSKKTIQPIKTQDLPEIDQEVSR